MYHPAIPRTDRSEDGEPDIPSIPRAAMPGLVSKLVDYIGIKEMSVAEVLDASGQEFEGWLADIGKEEYPACPELLNAVCCRLLRDAVEER